MNFEQLIENIRSLDLNLYDFALYTDDGVHACKIRPSNNCNDSYSVAKLFITTALGMLWDKGRLDLDAPVCSFFPEYTPADPRWQKVTIDHALTHRIGFDAGFLDIDVEDVNAYPTDDYLEMVFSHPIAYEPGTHRQYSDAAFYLLARLAGRLAGEGVDSFLWKHLLKPMQFKEVAWSRCPHEHPIGATGLYISSGDMVKLGALYLNDGIWNGQRLLSEEWVHLAIDRKYELHTLDDTDFIGKRGMYEQGVAFSKERGIAIAFHAFEKRSILAALKDLL